MSGHFIARRSPSRKWSNDVIPEHGLGRALVTALDQFATQSGHEELRSAKLLLFGFSATGSLALRMAAYIPKRTAATVAYAPGQYEPFGVDTVVTSREVAVTPQFIIANGRDDRNGTARPCAYALALRAQGAPITFVIQNNTPHCCVLNIKMLMLQWFQQPRGFDCLLRHWTQCMNSSSSLTMARS